MLVASGLILIVAAVSTHPIFRLVTALPDALGFREKKTYLVLLQNNTELRPTGGFMGTFSLITMNRGKPTIKIEDIYTPDGQAARGHVEPPAPIQEAFQLGEWRLRDANWDPDFPSSTQTIEWFMEKGGISGIDGTIATNLIVFEEMLKILGPIGLPDYKDVVTAENLWLLGEQYAQDAFFPGSIQKKEFFSDLASTVLREFQNSSMRKKLTLLRLALRMLQEKHLMLSFHDVYLQSGIDSLSWSGRMLEASCPLYRPRCVPESLMIVEANLGVNKANCCVTRKAELNIMPVDDSIHHKLTVTFTNSSTSELWGGRYKAWVRIYANAKEQTGFWVDVPENENRTYSVEVEYDLPNLTGHQDLPISLLVQKQSGITEYPLTIKIERKDRDREKTEEMKAVIRTDRMLVL